jgi:hypothetical protein
MDYEFNEEKEEALLLAKECVGDAAEALEEYLPDTSEELVWIRETLLRELIVLQSKIGEAAGNGELN